MKDNSRSNLEDKLELVLTGLARQAVEKLLQWSDYKMRRT